MPARRGIRPTIHLVDLDGGEDRTPVLGPLLLMVSPRCKVGATGKPSALVAAAEGEDVLKARHSRRGTQVLVNRLATDAELAGRLPSSMTSNLVR